VVAVEAVKLPTYPTMVLNKKCLTLLIDGPATFPPPWSPVANRGHSQESPATACATPARSTRHTHGTQRASA
jgi:hypothetical protein